MENSIITSNEDISVLGSLLTHEYAFLNSLSFQSELYLTNGSFDKEKIISEIIDNQKSYISKLESYLTDRSNIHRDAYLEVKADKGYDDFVNTLLGFTKKMMTVYQGVLDKIYNMNLLHDIQRILENKNLDIDKLQSLMIVKPQTPEEQAMPAKEEVTPIVVSKTEADLNKKALLPMTSEEIKDPELESKLKELGLYIYPDFLKDSGGGVFYGLGPEANEAMGIKYSPIKGFESIEDLKIWVNKNFDKVLDLLTMLYNDELTNAEFEEEISALAVLKQAKNKQKEPLKIMVDYGIPKSKLVAELSNLLNADLQPLKTLESAIYSSIDRFRVEGLKDEEIGLGIKDKYRNWYLAYPSLIEHLIDSGISRTSKQVDTDNSFKYVTFETIDEFDKVRSSLKDNDIGFSSNDETMTIEVYSKKSEATLNNILKDIKCKKSDWFVDDMHNQIVNDSIKTEAKIIIDTPFDRTKGLWEITTLDTGEKVFAKKKSLLQKVNEKMGIAIHSPEDVVREIVCDIDGTFQPVKIVKDLGNKKYLIQNLIDKNTLIVNEASLFPKFNAF